MVSLFPSYMIWIKLTRTGPIVRYGPSKLLFNDPEAFQDIYGISRNTMKAKSYLSMIPIEGARSIFTSLDKTRHRHKRKLISEALSDASIRDFEPNLVRYIESMVQTLDMEQDPSGWSKVQNFSDNCTCSC